MGDEIIFDAGYFPREADFWYNTSLRLGARSRSFENGTALPALTGRVSEALDMLIPALNKAQEDIAHNLKLGSSAAVEIGRGLTAVSQNYETTELEATGRAGWVPNND